jgi:hypothetical protein
MALGGGSKILVVIPAQMWFHERDATRGGRDDVLVGGGRGKRLEVEEIHVSEHVRSK